MTDADQMIAARHDWESWRQARHDELAAPDSWLGLSGLYWLEEGTNPVGSAPDCVVTLPAGPEQLGEIIVLGNQLLWSSRADKALSIDGVIHRHTADPSGMAEQKLQVPLASDQIGAPSVLAYGTLRFFVIAREGRLAVRVKQLDWAKSQPFLGLDAFPFAPDWIIDAEWQALPAKRQIEVPAVTGELKLVEITHLARFWVGQVEVSLLPLSVDEQGVFFVFRDQTSGRLSYGGGRFLKAAPAQAGRIQLDFNRAYNPPCAFSPFATCPLPPPENWLGFPVEAGELRYASLAGH